MSILLEICIGEEAFSYLYCTNEIIQLLFIMNNNKIINISVCVFFRLLIMLH